MPSKASKKVRLIFHGVFSCMCVKHCQLWMYVLRKSIKINVPFRTISSAAEQLLLCEWWPFISGYISEVNFEILILMDVWGKSTQKHRIIASLWMVGKCYINTGLVQNVERKISSLLTEDSVLYSVDWVSFKWVQISRQLILHACTQYFWKCFNPNKVPTNPKWPLLRIVIPQQKAYQKPPSGHLMGHDKHWIRI